jgi:arylsulfatase
MSATDDQPTNLLFITSDQQRWDTLPCYGREFMQTPNLDRLATEGMVFEQCHVPAPSCVPCRAALLSGQWPSTVSGMGNSCPPAIAPTWPQRLGEAGFHTTAIGKMHFSPWNAMGGFDQRIIAEDKRHVYLPDDHVMYLRAHGLERPHPTDNPHYFEYHGASVFPHDAGLHVDGFTGDRATDWLRSNAQRPFAAWVSFPGPHDPYDPPAEMAEMYYDAPIPEPVGSRDELATKPKAQARAGKSNARSAMYQIDYTAASPEQIRRWRAHYYANISLIDDRVGKMLAVLEEAGVLDRTLVIYTSDHGDALGDHGMPFKSFFYDCMVRVPLLMRGPGVSAGSRCPALVSSLDLVPLFYDALGVDKPDTLQGQDLRPLLSDPDAPFREHVFSESGAATMVRDHRWKYAYYQTGESELYDLEADPDELTNLAAGEHGDVELEMRGHLLQHAFEVHRGQTHTPTPGGGRTDRYRAEVEAEYRARTGQ